MKRLLKIYQKGKQMHQYFQNYIYGKAVAHSKKSLEGKCQRRDHVLLQQRNQQWQTLPHLLQSEDVCICDLSRENVPNG